MDLPEHHNSRLFLTHGTTVKARTQDHEGFVIIRNGLKELEIFSHEKKFGVLSPVSLESGRSGSKDQWSQAPEDNIDPELGGALDQPRRTSVCL